MRTFFVLALFAALLLVPARPWNTSAADAPVSEPQPASAPDPFPTSQTLTMWEQANWDPVGRPPGESWQVGSAAHPDYPLYVFVERPVIFQVNESQDALVPGRTMGAKAIVRSTGATPSFGVLAQFYDPNGSWQGDELRRFYELKPENVTRYFTIDKTQDTLKFDRNDTKIIYFEGVAPPFGVSEIGFWVWLDPDGVVPDEGDPGDDEARVTRSVWETHPSNDELNKLRVYALLLDGVDPESLPRTEGLGRRMEQLLPLSPGQAWVLWDHSPYPPSPVSERRMSIQEFTNYYNDIEKRALRANPDAARLVGYLPEDWFTNRPGPNTLYRYKYYHGFSQFGGRLVLAALEKRDHQGVGVQRELAHSLGLYYPRAYGLFEVEDGILISDWPSTRLRFRQTGVRNHEGERLYVSSFMQGYWFCPWCVFWARGDDWNTLLQKWRYTTQGQGAAAPTAGEIIQVSGRLSAAGGGQLDPAYRMPKGEVDAPATGAYALALVGASGNDLYTFSFPVSFTPEWAPEDMLESFPFSFVLPWMPGTARIVLRHSGAELAALAVSPNAPMVQVLTPNGGGTLSGQQNVTWTANDADGGSLLYTVQYSPDGGANWTLLAMDLSATSFSWDTSLSPGGADGRIRVTACDGANTGSDMSDAGFTLANHPPSAAIFLPAAGSTFLQGYPVALQGSGYDLEDGSLADDRLSWGSDRDGAVGSGAELTAGSLSVGSHVLTLTGRDAQDATATATTNVTVVAAGQPDVSLSGEAISFLPEPVAAERPAAVIVSAANVITDTLCTFDFYDGDPEAGGALIDSQIARVRPDAPGSVTAEWQPATTGMHTVFVRVSGCNPAESNTANNTASRSVEVVEAPVSHTYLPLVLRMSGGGPTPGWQVIFADGFEGSFPGAWQRFGNPGWGRTSCKSASGAYSVWPAADGTGAVAPCTNNYPNNLAAWLVYGPFSLQGATAAELTFQRWERSQADVDYLSWMASVDGQHFYGWRGSADSGGWVAETLNLANVYTLGSLLGQPQVWIALRFTSNANTNDLGAFVDDVVLRKRTDGGAQSLSSEFAYETTQGVVPSSKGP